MSFKSGQCPTIILPLLHDTLGRAVSVSAVFSFGFPNME